MNSRLTIVLLSVFTACCEGTSFCTYDCWRYTGQNIAFNKNASQLPGTYQEPNPPYFSYQARLAVDGNENNDPPLRSCSSTNGSSGETQHVAQWAVDLGGQFNISGILIIIRKDYAERQKNFAVFGWNKKICSDWCLIYSETIHSAYKQPKIYIPLNSQYLFSSVAVNLPRRLDGKKTYLTLCEVKIYAAQPACRIIEPLSNGIVEIYNDSGSTVNGFYTAGTVLKVSCSEGYQRIGSSVVKCLYSGHFNSTTPLCTHACPAIEKSGHITELKSDNQLYLANTQVTIICEHGYKTTTKNPIICQSGGKWDSTIPTCQPIKCPYLSKTENGYYAIDQPVMFPYADTESAFGTKLRGVCDPGYESNNYQKRVCQINETWSGQETICTPVLCSHPGNITNGAYVLNNSSKVLTEIHFSYKTVLQISCYKGYTSCGQAERTCQSDKTWSGKEPYCDIVKCDFPGRFEYGHYGIRKESITQKDEIIPYIKDKLSYSIEIEAICVKGYILNSSEIVRQCTYEGVWTGKNQVCVPVFCQWPISIENGYYKASQNETTYGMPYNTILLAFCYDNFKLTDTYQIRRCDERAVWDKEPATCTPSIMQEQKSINAVLIGGLSSTVIILLVVVAVLAFFLYLRRHKPQKESETSMTYTDLQISRNQSSDNDYAAIVENNPRITDRSAIDDTQRSTTQCGPEYCNTLIEHLP